MKTKTFKEITLLNAALCLGVVIIHLTSFPLAELQQESIWYLLIFVVNKFFCFCVPAFLFLSGFKLYHKYREGIPLKAFYQNRFSKIVVPYLIATAVYFIYFLLKGWATFRELPQYVFLGTLSAHFYYIIISVQFYFLFPLLAKALMKHDTLVLILSGITIVVFQQCIRIPYGDRFFGSYILYFVFGMYAAKTKLFDRMFVHWKGMIVAFIGVAVLHIGLSFLSTRGIIFYHFAEIVNIVYVLLSILVLLFVSRCCRNVSLLQEAATVMSNTSYQIYLYHCLVISFLRYDILARFHLSVRYEFLCVSIMLVCTIALYCVLGNYMKNKKNHSL
ncbi:MAG: acyltransferase [Ruminococcaceae bacterium]|nr:acyltransferase [Oscillospiraceae bacterium]